MSFGFFGSTVGYLPGQVFLLILLVQHLLIVFLVVFRRHRALSDHRLLVESAVVERIDLVALLVQRQLRVVALVLH